MLVDEDAMPLVKLLGWVFKIIKYLFSTKVGRLVLLFFVLLNMGGALGSVAEQYYNSHFANSTEFVKIDSVSRPVLNKKDRHKKANGVNPMPQTNYSQARPTTEKGKIIGIVASYMLVVFGIVVYIVIAVFRKGKSGGRVKSKPHKRFTNDYSLSIPLTENKNVVVIANPFRGIFINGDAGSGKTESMIIPLIAQCAEKDFAGIIYDFKNPELIKIALHYYENSNVKTCLIDFKNPTCSARINPLNLDSSTSKIVDLSLTLFYNLAPETIKDKNFFVSEAINLFTGITIYIRNKHPKYFTIPHVVSAILYCDIKELIKKACLDAEARPFLSSIFQAISNEAAPQLAGVLSTLMGKLAQVCTAEAFYILSGNDVSLNLNHPDNPTMLLIGNDSTSPDVFPPLISCIISACVRNMNEEGKHHSVIMVDEAPTIYIPKIEQIPATARSNRIALVYACQDHSQNIAKYGQDNAATIISNLGNQFYFRTINKNTAQLVSDLFDKEDVEYESNNKSKSNNFSSMGGSTSKGSSVGVQERRRVKISDITNLRPGEFYALVAEGNYTEVLKKRVKQNAIEKPQTELEKLVSKETIENIFVKIISEAKDNFL